MIRAPTWGERWDLFKSSRQTSFLTAQPLSNKPAYTTASETLSNHISPRKSKSRLGITFLASASSDLDEGFEPSADDRDAYSLLGLDRPSPRKVLHQNVTRSLVGYTPDISIEEEIIEPPIRTSTPVYAQGRLGGDGVTMGLRARSNSPDLPPYSVSDISQILDTAHSDNDEPSTPRIHARSPILQTPSRDKWNDQTLKEMERRADEFYKLGLLGRCWDVWFASHTWLETTIGQIDMVRRKILLRQALIKWKDATEYQLGLPGTADSHRRLHLQSMAMKRWIERIREKRLDVQAEQLLTSLMKKRQRKIWTRWRVSVVEKRTERWRKAIHRKEREFARVKNKRVLFETFSVCEFCNPPCLANNRRGMKSYVHESTTV